MPVRPWFREFREKGERSTQSGEHIPVLLNEVLTALNLQLGHIVVDCTLGFAGHAAELLNQIGPTGRLIAFDADPSYVSQAEVTLSAVGHPFHIHRGNFASIASVLAERGIERVDGLLADLGMSSMQVDDPLRGFSFMRDGPLDMRMDISRGRTAAELINALSEAIERERKRAPIATTAQLKELILKAAPVTVVKSPGLGPAEKQKMRPTVRVFQALRMLVNRELGNLQQLLRMLPQIVKPGGTAAIISFHSGEDRLVKTAFRDGVRDGIYSSATDDPIRPSEEEKAANPRSRSAKLRWVKRVESDGVI